MEMSRQDSKPVFCVDVTSDKRNSVANGSEFVIRTVSKWKTDEYEDKLEDYEQAIEKSRFPLWLRILKYACGMFFLIVLSSTLKVGLEKALQNAPILVISGAICGVAFGVLYIASKGREKKLLTDVNAEQQSKEIDHNIQSIYDELNVPKNALEVDVLTFRYQLKNGKIRLCAPGLQTTPYTNMSVKMYATLDEVYIADLENVYSFKKSEIKALTTVNKRISVSNWNKREDPRTGIYIPYKMTVNNLGDIFMKPYYILEIEREGQAYGIYFPCYEIKTVEFLSGLKAGE